MTNDPRFKIEETGRTAERSVQERIPGTENRKIFARGPIRRHAVTNLPGEGGRSWPIYDWIMLQDGRWFDFNRVAQMDSKGVVDLEQVAMRTEVIIVPGIVYRQGIVNTAELAKWRAAQDKISSKLTGDSDTSISVTSTNNGLDTRV